MNNITRPKVRRATNESMPSTLPLGELALNTDNSELYVGTNKGNLKVTTNESVGEINKQLPEIKQDIENHEERITTNEGVISQLSNPNLLINGDFQVWSKGTSFNYISDSFPFIADKWRVGLVGGGQVIKTSSNTMQITFNKNANNLGQIIDILPIGTYTLSAKIKTSNIFYMSIDINGKIDEEHNKKKCTGNGEFSIYTLTFNVTTPNSSVIVYPINDCEIGTVEIEWVKLELGSIVTPFVSKPYVQELQDCLMYQEGELITPYSNENILINGNFQVWQRGDSFDLTKATQYTADRWCVYRTNYQGGGTIQRHNYNQLLIRPSSTEWNYFVSQTLEELDTYPLRGKTLTVSTRVHKTNSIGVNIGVSYVTTGVVNPGTGYNLARTGAQQITSGDYGDISLTFTVPQNATSICVYVEFVFSGVTLQDYASVQYVKLELGKIATPCTLIPYTEELAMCERYYEIVDFSHRIFTTLPVASVVELNAPYKTQKRTSPSQTISFATLDDIPINTINVFASGDRIFGAYIHNNASQFPQGSRIVYKGIADAEIY